MLFPFLCSDTRTHMLTDCVCALACVHCVCVYVYKYVYIHVVRHKRNDTVPVTPI
jgi:hypothetical protein